jgi:hypothetical protein
MSTTSALLTTSVANVYASSGNTAVTWLSINNYSVSNVTANVHVVPSGGTANVQNQILTNLEIAAGDTYQLYSAGEKLLLENDTAVQAVANVNTALNIVVSYTTI